MGGLSQTVLRWIAAIVALLVVMAIGAWLFGGPIIAALKGQRDRAEQKAETNADDAAGRRLEAEAGQALASEQQELVVRVEQGVARVHIVEREIRADPTGDGLLPDADARRLRDHDAVLCAESPASCAAGEGPAGRGSAGGDSGLPAVRPARQPDE